ncbi:MAG: A/G-specific adenine glycosylase [Planctomycetia bacterium 21-64-5]|nr:MAG: A/G-specific adenine glycosylase [Planctomycetia bacterium 21-64-5]HQU45449.1 A/G-specific adenine glycosylase [Pirellulales bacterium]
MKTPCQWPTTAWKRQFRRKLLGWYARHARDLDWRQTSDPYRVWVSEIMLQQTQVATVAGYFSRFLAEFPTLDALAAADEHQVLRLWEGLGYYRRARQLHRAAGIIVREHGGRFPADPQAVRALPGIGRYTAGAILSIAFDARQPILEANTVRLLSRLLAYHGDPRKKEGESLLWKFAEDLLPRRGSGTFNQALMELGSLVCTPRNPACGACPVKRICPTEARSLQGVIPRAKTKPRVEAVREALIVVRRGAKVLLRQRQPDERWAGLWDFPRFSIDAGNGDLADELAAKLAATTGVVAHLGERLTTIKHGVTRFRITLDCYLADCAAKPRRLDNHCRWVYPDELARYPLSTTGRKVAVLLSLSLRPVFPTVGRKATTTCAT